MSDHTELDIRDRLDHNGRATITLGPGQRAWNPRSEKDPLVGEDREGFLTVVEYQEFPDGSWSVRVTDPTGEESHHRSDPQ